MMRGLLKRILPTALGSMMLTACDSVDCTLNNIVACNYAFYNHEGKAVELTGVLTVSAMGTDSVLFNQGRNISTLSLPMSYWAQADTLVFDLEGEDYSISQSFVVHKTNTEHFESPDCPINMFHEITNVDLLRHGVIDSVVVVKNSVNFDTNENIRIYLHTDNE